MKNDFDEILKQALTPIEEPDFWLNQSILNQSKETGKMKKGKIRNVPVFVLSMVLVLGLATTGIFAALKYLAPDDVAKGLSDTKLMQAFKGNEAVAVNETQNYGDYDVTLLGLVSGDGISDYLTTANDELKSDRTYAVTAISKADGTPMPNTSDEEYSDLSYFVSPLIQGYDPAKYNAVTMNGGYSEFTQDGVLYRLTECDNVEMFADSRIYLCVSDSTFYNADAYIYNEASGEISKNQDYKGMNALFTLPIDASRADAAAVQEYLKTMENGSTGEDEIARTEADEFMDTVTPGNIDKVAVRVESTVKTVKPDADGMINANYELENGASGEGAVAFDQIFPGGKQGMSEMMDYSYSDGGVKSLVISTYTLNKDGTVTFAVYVPR